jgi:hypothetical protein
LWEPEIRVNATIQIAKERLAPFAASRLLEAVGFTAVVAVLREQLLFLA